MATRVASEKVFEEMMERDPAGTLLGLTEIIADPTTMQPERKVIRCMATILLCHQIRDRNHDSRLSDLWTRLPTTTQTTITNVVTDQLDKEEDRKYRLKLADLYEIITGKRAPKRINLAKLVPPPQKQQQQQQRANKHSRKSMKNASGKGGNKGFRGNCRQKIRSGWKCDVLGEVEGSFGGREHVAVQGQCAPGADH